MPNNTQKIARIISTVFVPPSFTIILFTIFAFKFEDNPLNKTIVVLTALTFGFFFHIFLFVYLRRRGLLGDIDASVKEERSLPYFIATLLYVCGFFILVLNESSIISTAFWFCYISNTLIILFINKFWKISAHAMGAAGPLAAVMIAFGLFALIPFFILVIIGWSRINLKCHSFAQVMAGAIMGFTSTYIQMHIIIENIGNGG